MSKDYGRLARGSPDGRATCPARLPPSISRMVK
jgi:hypothetical protein